MCLICIELIKQRMTPTEARKAATEIIRTETNEHVEALAIAIDNLDFDRIAELLEEGESDVL